MAGIRNCENYWRELPWGDYSKFISLLDTKWTRLKDRFWKVEESEKFTRWDKQNLGSTLIWHVKCLSCETACLESRLVLWGQLSPGLETEEIGSDSISFVFTCGYAKWAIHNHHRCMSTEEFGDRAFNQQSNEVNKVTSLSPFVYLCKYFPCHSFNVGSVTWPK